MTYNFTIYGRTVGSLGVLYYDYVTLEAEDYDKAVLKLYDTHEHVSIIRYSIGVPA